MSRASRASGVFRSILDDNESEGGGSCLRIELSEKKSDEKRREKERIEKKRGDRRDTNE